MHRTQIYLQEAVYDCLKARARNVGVSVSELIRRTLEKDIQKDPVSDAITYFERLKPLDSFADKTSADYVRQIRSTSRLLRQKNEA